MELRRFNNNNYIGHNVIIYEVMKVNQSLANSIKYDSQENLSCRDLEALTRWYDGNIYKTDTARIQSILCMLHWLSDKCDHSDSFLYSSNKASALIGSFAERFNIPYQNSRRLIEQYISDDQHSRPTFIAVEGLDGAGKTVQCNLLADYLRQCNKRVYCIDFPQYNGLIGKEIGYFLSGNDSKVNAESIDPKSMCLWYATDRWNTLKNVNFAEYDFVIFNRYSLSSAVYQTARSFGAVNSDFIEWVFELEHVVFGLPAPDVYLFLDTEMAGCANNLSNKGERPYVDGLDLYERSTSLLKCCRSIYQYCVTKYPSVHRICCNDGINLLSVSDIHTRIVKELRKIGLAI